MKKTELYAFIEKRMTTVGLTIQKFISDFSDKMSISEINQNMWHIKASQKSLEELKMALYLASTPEEITFIVSEGNFDTDYSWSKPEQASRLMLPDHIYCTHEQYIKDKKLQALMPNKKF